MHLPKLASLLSAAAFLAVPASTQSAVYGISERLPPFTPLHTAIYTTTLPQKQPPQVITTVVVTLFVPRDVGWPNGATPVTGTAVSHFFASGITFSWAETAKLTWTLRGTGNTQQETDIAAPNAKATTLTALYTDYSHYTTEMYGFLSQARFDYVSTYRETLVEEIGANYPATMIHTGRTTIEITVT
ncbi:hypothetical protein V8F20_007545, partial [Naviculisporaceae sp. PSN 640]